MDLAIEPAVDWAPSVGIVARNILILCRGASIFSV
jgi:hypothetical protein